MRQQQIKHLKDTQDYLEEKRKEHCYNQAIIEYLYGGPRPPGRIAIEFEETLMKNGGKKFVASFSLIHDIILLDDVELMRVIVEGTKTSIYDYDLHPVIRLQEPIHYLDFAACSPEMARIAWPLTDTFVSKNALEIIYDVSMTFSTHFGNIIIDRQDKIFPTLLELEFDKLNK
ncbi:MAG: hypothetical protein ACTSUE_26385 [Promethearchaeota archaeon]